MTTPATQAVDVLNGLIANAQALMAVANAIPDLDNRWNDQTVATLLGNMSTTAVNSDGTYGAEDGSPNSSHPVLYTTYPPLLRGLSSTQFSQIKSVLDGFLAYINTGGNRAILNAAVGG